MSGISKYCQACPVQSSEPEVLEIQSACPLAPSWLCPPKLHAELLCLKWLDWTWSSWLPHLCVCRSSPGIPSLHFPPSLSSLIKSQGPNEVLHPDPSLYSSLSLLPPFLQCPNFSGLSILDRTKRACFLFMPHVLMFQFWKLFERRTSVHTNAHAHMYACSTYTWLCGFPNTKRDTMSSSNHFLPYIFEAQFHTEVYITSF